MDNHCDSHLVGFNLYEGSPIVTQKITPINNVSYSSENIKCDSCGKIATVSISTKKKFPSGYSLYGGTTNLCIKCWQH